jgi:hypothetical protein
LRAHRESQTFSTASVNPGTVVQRSYVSFRQLRTCRPIVFGQQGATTCREQMQQHGVQKQNYSITSSARPSSIGGTVRPSVLAVLRLIGRGLSHNEIARALISMMVGSHNVLQSETGYIDARPHPPRSRNFLQRTAGPYIRVNRDRKCLAPPPLKHGGSVPNSASTRRLWSPARWVDTVEKNARGFSEQN